MISAFNLFIAPLVSRLALQQFQVSTSSRNSITSATSIEGAGMSMLSWRYWQQLLPLNLIVCYLLGVVLWLLIPVLVSFTSQVQLTVQQQGLTSRGKTEA
jgi:hypothetical protein